MLGRFQSCCAALGLFACSASAAILPLPPLPSTINLDFDVDAAGNPIVHGQIIDDEYLDWGVRISVRHPRLSRLDFGIALDTAVSIEADSRTSTAHGAYHPTNTAYLGNVLIAPRNKADSNNDGIIDTPDTAYERPNGQFTFTLDRAWQSGALTILDAEEAGGTIKAYQGNTLVHTTSIPALGDNSVVRLNFGGQSPFNKIVVQLAGSGGLESLTLQAVPEPATAALAAACGALALRRRR